MATCVCGALPNQCRGMVRFTVARYSVPSNAIAYVLMSSAEWANRLDPANLIRYQYTNMKSNAAG
jgi:hypothetical protein